MKRRDVHVGLLLTAVCRADAREHGKPNRVAFVAPLHPADISETGDSGPLFKELRRLGYVVGQNLIVDWYTGEGRVERYGELARDVVRLKPDLVFATTTAIAQNLKEATATIPLVGIVVDPIGFGLVNNLARPGGNFTGVSVDAGIEIWGKRLELLKEVSPKLSRVGVGCPAIRITTAIQDPKLTCRRNVDWPGDNGGENIVRPRWVSDDYPAKQG